MSYEELDEQCWSFDSECEFMQGQRMFTLYDDDGECRWIPLAHYSEEEQTQLEAELYALTSGCAFRIDWDFPVAEAVAVYNRGIPPEYHLKDVH
jgi:hypothetical protein